MAKEHAWLWALGGVVVLYALGSNQRAQQVAAAQASGTTATSGIMGALQNLFGGGATVPAAQNAAAGAITQGSYGPYGTPAGGNPSNYAPANYSGSPYSTPMGGPPGSTPASGLQQATGTPYTSPAAAASSPGVFAI